MKKTNLSILVGALTWCALPTAAQVADHTGAAVAAVAHVRRILPPGSAMLEISSDASEAQRQQTTKLGKALGFPLTPSDSALRCETHLPSSCRLLPASVLLSPGTPVIQDGTVSVVVGTRYMSGSRRQPVANTLFRVQLIRTPDGWRVVRDEILFTT